MVGHNIGQVSLLSALDGDIGVLEAGAILALDSHVGSGEADAVGVKGVVNVDLLDLIEDGSDLVIVKELLQKNDKKG